jgi:hypothetical protein
MANPFSVEPVNALQALLMQGQGMDAGFKPIQQRFAMQEQIGKQRGRDLLSQMLQSGGQPDYGKLAIGMLASGDAAGAGVLANLVNQQAQRDFQGQSLDLQRQAANKPVLTEIYDEQTGQPKKVLMHPGTGAHQPVGGAKVDKPRQMSVTDVGKLQEEGGKFSNLTGFATTFKDDYAQAVTGNLRNAAARNLPEFMTAPDAREAATWWQGYDRFKNVVRNDLFGSALTATEQAAFEKADVNPTMAPSLIRENLKKQKEIAEAGLKKKAAALISEGYRPESIAAAYGIKLEDLGVSTQRGGAQPKPAPSSAQQFQEGQTATNPQTGEKRVFRGGQWVPVQ